MRSFRDPTGRTAPAPAWNERAVAPHHFTAVTIPTTGARPMTTYSHVTVTEAELPPPGPRWGWCATAGTYDGAPDAGRGSAIGWGPTPEDAIADLKEQLNLCATPGCLADGVDSGPIPWMHCQQHADDAAADALAARVDAAHDAGMER